MTIRRFEPSTTKSSILDNALAGVAKEEEVLMAADFIYCMKICNVMEYACIKGTGGHRGYI